MGGVVVAIVIMVVDVGYWGCVCVCVCVLGSYGQFLAIFGVVVWLLFLGFCVFFFSCCSWCPEEEVEREEEEVREK